MEQYYLNPQNYEEEMEELLQQLRVRNILLVCGQSFYQLHVYPFIKSLQKNKSISITLYNDFSLNPKYEEVLQGVKVFEENMCDFILAVGGGSAIDVAKCIKLFVGLEKNEDYLCQKIIENKVPLFAIPTTAGSGSETTQFAVIYIKGNKHSIEHKSVLPKYVLLYPNNLITLPIYQKKATVCDALSHAIESYWALYSSVKSRELSETAICLILDNIAGYLKNDVNSCKNIMLASNFAGQAINITKTTAAHAMCYKLTSLFGIPHGHAVMLCLPEVWEYMQKKLDVSINDQKKIYLEKTFSSLAHCLKQETPKNAIQFLKRLRSKLGLELMEKVDEKQLTLLIDSVNVERLKNSPIILKREDLRVLYQKVLWRN